MLVLPEGLRGEPNMASADSLETAEATAARAACGGRERGGDDNAVRARRVRAVVTRAPSSVRRDLTACADRRTI